MRKRKNLGKRILAAALALVLTATTVVDAKIPVRGAEEDKEFTVWFNEDGVTGIAAGQYGSYPIYAGEAMAAKTSSIVVDGKTYYTVQGTSNPKTNGGNPNGAIPTSGAYLKVVAPGDGIITVYGFAASKPFYATKGTTPAINGETAFTNDTNSHSVSVKEGEEWYFYAQGSKAVFAGVKFENAKPDVTIPVRLEGSELNDATIFFQDVNLGDVVTISSTDETVTLKEESKYIVGINSSSLVIDLENLDLSSGIPEEIVITVTQAPKHAVSGNIMGLPEGAVVTELVFTDKAGVAVNATVDGMHYTVNLKNGDYTTSASVSSAEGYSVYDHVLVEGINGESVENDVWFYGAAPVYGNTYKEVLKVGTKAGCDYATIMEAIAAVKAMTREDSQRVTLLLCDEEYVEQVIVDAQNVSLVAAEGVEPVVRWYYGIGYKYYSIGADGYYNLKSKNDKYEMHYAQRWGTVVRVKANGFYAENVTFLNTFNRYVCAEELGDSKVGTAAEYGQGISGSLQERVEGLDVANTTNVERAAAIALDADEAEFYKCSFISSQDTVYTGSNKAYFNECSLAGQTDYIFGNEGCAAIFDNCELKWLGYTGTPKSGYITATRGAYLFRGCKIVNNDEEGYTVAPGFLGRPWGAAAKVAFIGTEIEEQAICAEAWASMSGVEPATVAFREYGNTVGGENFYSSFAKNETENNFKLTEEQALVLADPANDSAYLSGMALQHPITAPLDLSDVSDWNAGASENEEDKPADSTNKFVLESSSLTAFAAGAKADGDMEQAGTNNFFSIIYSAKSKVDTSDKTFDDGYASGKRINLGGAVSTEKNAIKFTVDNKATVKVWWVEGGDDNRQMQIINSNGTAVVTTDVTVAKNACVISTMELEEAGTYYLGGATNNNYIFKVEVEVEEASREYVLETSQLTAFAAGAKADGDMEQAGTENYFSIIYSAKSKVDSSSKTFEDGYVSGQRLNLGGAVSTSKNAIKFSINKKATVKVWWVEAGDDNRQMQIINSNGTAVVTTDVTAAKNACVISTMELEEAGTYYLGGATNNNYIFKVQVVETAGTRPPRADWSTVTAPVITEVSEAQGIISVNVTANVGYDGADKVTVVMMDKDGKEVASKTSSRETTEHSLTFVPGASGDYSFVAKLLRGEEEKLSSSKNFNGFVLPLTKPVIKTATSVGNGAVEVEWNAVKEAEEYIVACGDKSVRVNALKAKLTGLSIGEKVTVTVTAVRGTDKSEAGSIDVTVTEEAQRVWGFTTYGSSTSTSKDKVTGNILEDGRVTISSTGNGGKIVPASTDGLAYYYTIIDPTKENFTLRAKFHVDSWKFTNGQEGFGIMAADAIGENGNASAFWNNCFQVIGTKIEYYSDGEKVTTDNTQSKISMYNGLGYIAKTGVTLEGLAEMAASSSLTMPKGFETAMGPLETSCIEKGAGSYNLIGNCSNSDQSKDLETLYTDFVLEIQRDNTGYRLRYLDEEGNVLSEKLFYDLERNALTKIDQDHIYVGFFAAREMTVTVSEMELTTIHPSQDAAAEERQYEYIELLTGIESGTTSNGSYYDLVYYGNADGKLTIKTKNGKVVADNVSVQANKKAAFETVLSLGNNEFLCEFTPDADFMPAEYTKLSSYEKRTFSHTVCLKELAGTNIYVSPDGKADGKGTQESPLDIYTAVKYVKPGQKILLMGGTYHLSSTVKVERGIDGLGDKKIYMIADPDSKERPVLDFGGKCAGMILAGDYWYFQGFDVTGSANGTKGIQVSGDYNTLDSIRTYKNGNTGIQISRYLGSDGNEDWPSYNTILNCTSYLNADRGYEDADGFAAKLTIGEGNVFDGCIAAYNADDGWDLFAKAQTGPIGVVTIKNCIAFKNGYVLDEFGREVNAGNGNGFKMGGESITGAHVLMNSIAFANKAKGIDSNSGPNIRVYHSTSFNNESYNVAFYTNNASQTDFVAEGILSYKNLENAIVEQIKLKGEQENTSTDKYKQVYNFTNFFVTGTKDSKNTEGKAVKENWFEECDVEAVLSQAISEMLSNDFGLVKAGVASRARVFSLGITRALDGTINMNGFLELTEEAPAEVGARVTGEGTASTVIDITVEENPSVDETEEDKNLVQDNGSGTLTPPKQSDVKNRGIWFVTIFAGLLLIGGALFVRKRRS